MNVRCGKVIGAGMGYRKVCGGFWCGEIVQCDECREAEQRRRILEKQEKVLDMQLRSNHE